VSFKRLLLKVPLNMVEKLQEQMQEKIQTRRTALTEATEDPEKVQVGVGCGSHQQRTSC
jgi:hypothetical protein